MNTNLRLLIKKSSKIWISVGKRPWLSTWNLKYWIPFFSFDSLDSFDSFLSFDSFDH